MNEEENGASVSITQWIFSNSYLVAALAIFLIGIVVVWRIRLARTYKFAIVLGMASVLIVGDFFFRVGISEITSVQQFDSILAGNQPVLLEIYSNT